MDPKHKATLILKALTRSLVLIALSILGALLWILVIRPRINADLYSVVVAAAAMDATKPPLRVMAQVHSETGVALLPIEEVAVRCKPHPMRYEYLHRAPHTIVVQ